MRTYKFVASMFAISQLGSGVALAQQGTYAERAREEAYFEHGVQMAQLNFDVPHAALIESCNAKYPESVPELARSIAAWRAANFESQIELRSLIRKKSSLSESAISEKINEDSKDFEWQLRHLPPKQLDEFCNGGYAQVTLKLPEMDFTSLLSNLRAKGIFK